MRQLLTRWLFVIVELVALQACNTEVELCYYSDHPHRATLDVRYDWDEWADKGKHPERMYVLAHRIVNTYKYVFSTETKASGNRGSLLFPIEEQMLLNPLAPETSNVPETPAIPEAPGEPEISEGASDGNDTPSTETDAPAQSEENAGNGEEGVKQPESEVWHKMRLKNGTYRFLAFNCDTKAFDIDGLKEFQENPDYDIENLYLKYRTVPKADKDGALAWKDYNLYSDFVESDNAPIFYAVEEKVEAKLNERVVVTFRPNQITQRITVNFTINKEKGVRIDSLLADMSGIPSGIQMATGYLITDKTYKVLFKPTCSDNNENATTVSCTGALNVTSIVRSHDASLITGPGIMQLAVYTSTIDPETHVRKKKLLQCIINLRNTLTQAQLIRWSDDNEHIIQNKKIGTINIQNVLRIERDAILEDSDSDTGLDRWIDSTPTFDIDA